MSRQSTDLEDELEAEYEDEFESEYEDEFEYEDEDEWEQEDEDFFPLGAIANTIGGLLGEEEGEEEDEAFLGGLVGRLLGGGGGDGEEEYEGEFESEYEDEYEAEDEAEEFFGRLRNVFKKAAPFLRKLAKTAGPLVATAIGGPAAGALARGITSQLEGEMEAEVEAEFEEMASAPLTGAQALGEYLAAQAASSESEAEAEALAGVAAYNALSARDRRDLEAMLPALLRGAAVVTRMLHGNRRTRQAVRLTPGIVDGAARTLLRRTAAGEPVTPAEVGTALGAATAQVLGGGPARTAVMRRHAKGLARARRRYRGRGRGRYGSRARYGRGLRPRRPLRGRTGMIRRQPVRSRAVGGGTRVPRPRAGMVRVVTPIRIPARDGRAARTVRVVSDVKVPRGAVTAGRPMSVSGSSRRR
ncbi:hypothetical protein [Actinoplanes sp. NPDC051851]|uniref:hypothetical protein n=1 Tax=Actinoplanes sp. NPDC051851 TaxID=3154753 RepID=UPI00341B0917